MRITFSDDLKQWPQGYELAKKADEILRGVPQEQEDGVSGEWMRSRDESGKDVVGLKLKDELGEFARNFDLDVLQSRPGTAMGLHLLWGDILQARRRKQYQVFLATEQ